MDKQYQHLNMDGRNRLQRGLNQVAVELNNRPRKCLGFRTPAEVMAQQVRDLYAGVALQT